ncbi:MAG: putative toxin [Pseudolysinimonas sp.]
MGAATKTSTESAKTPAIEPSRRLSSQSSAANVRSQSSASQATGSVSGTVTEQSTGLALQEPLGSVVQLIPIYVGQDGSRSVGRIRIFDGLSNEAVSEVKNVASQAYTQQLKDSVAYAQENALRFDLYVRPDTYLTGPLRDAIGEGLVNLRYIP